MIKKLLIANRGEIACRIIKTAKKMGILTVAVYSEADKYALHVRMADEAIYIGPAPANQSYLSQKKILEAVKLSNACAVHPGYGFLSENAEFAQLMNKHNIIFVGPSFEAIKTMGDKIEAKKIAKDSGVSIIPGYIGAIKNEKEALNIAAKIGYPIMIKAAAGGGGKGIRVVRNKEEMYQAYSSTRNEAKNNFSDGRTFIEKFIENPRHIEIQLLADQHGNYVCLGERECSIQRHHQKVIEEAPSMFLSEKMRKKMYAQSIALAQKVGYFSVGTVEYIVDPKKNFYFLEMNTRLQVEHPVTELVTGIDIVEQMIRVAQGEKLQLKQKDITLNGWAIESRIYAEDPACGFLPSTGRITTYAEPLSLPGVRIDTGVYEGAEVSMFYDAMISKLCTYAPDRDSAIKIMNEALSQYVIRGISHNMNFLQSIINSQRFIAADISTNFIDEQYKGGFSESVLDDDGSAVVLCAAVYISLAETKRRFTINGQIRCAQKSLSTRWVVHMNDNNYPVIVRVYDSGYKISFENRYFFITSKWLLGSKLFDCTINGENYNVQIEYLRGAWNLTYLGAKIKVMVLPPRIGELKKYMIKSINHDVNNDLIANISGMVSDLRIQVGDIVMKGQHLVTVEAMKMENLLHSVVEGKVTAIHCNKGGTCNAGDVLIEIEPLIA